MAETLIDLYNNLLEYNSNKITVIVDDSDMPWFSAIGIA